MRTIRRLLRGFLTTKCATLNCSPSLCPNVCNFPCQRCWCAFHVGLFHSAWLLGGRHSCFGVFCALGCLAMEWQYKVTWLVGGVEEVRWRNKFWRGRTRQPKQWMGAQTHHLREYSDKGWELVDVREYIKGLHLYIRYYWKKPKHDWAQTILS